jgi:hypothetical protein
MSKLNDMNRIRTKGYRSQNEYDNFISDLTENELVVLNNKYNKDLIYYRIHQDLNIQENAQEYKEMQQRKKMLDEEIKKRKMFRNTTNSSGSNLWFNIETGTVLDPDNNVVEKICGYTIDFVVLENINLLDIRVLYNILLVLFACSLLL